MWYAISMSTNWRATLEKGKTMNTTTALDRILEAYNNASYSQVSKDDFSAEELAELESAIASDLLDGPASLPYALVNVLNTSDWKPWQFIQMTQELS